MPKEVNYTQEMVDTAVSMYAEGGNDALEAIAEKLERSVASVRSKLVREGVYKAAPKGAVSSAKPKGPTKKDLQATLATVAPEGYTPKDFDGATKNGIAWLIGVFSENDEADAETEAEGNTAEG